MNALFTIHNTPIGVNPNAIPQRTHSVLHSPHSIVYVCPQCGDAWGRIIFDTPGSRWLPIRRQCPKHGPPLILPYNDPYTHSSAPISVWAHEFLAAFAAAEHNIDPLTHRLTGGL